MNWSSQEKKVSLFYIYYIELLICYIQNKSNASMHIVLWSMYIIYKYFKLKKKIRKKSFEN